MRRFAIQVLAIWLGLVGLNAYYVFLALPVANGFSTMLESGVPLIILFVTGLLTFGIGIVAAMVALVSHRMPVVLLSAIALMVALTPIAGMIAQEVNK